MLESVERTTNLDIVDGLYISDKVRYYVSNRRVIVEDKKNEMTVGDLKDIKVAEIVYFMPLPTDKAKQFNVLYNLANMGGA